MDGTVAVVAIILCRISRTFFLFTEIKYFISHFLVFFAYPKKKKARKQKNEPNEYKNRINILNSFTYLKRTHVKHASKYIHNSSLKK